MNLATEMDRRLFRSGSVEANVNDASSSVRRVTGLGGSQMCFVEVAIKYGRDKAQSSPLRITTDGSFGLYLAMSF